MRAAVAGDVDVGRLDVPMDDQMAVRVLHGAEDLQKQHQTLAHGEPVHVAILVDRDAVDVLENQKRLPGSGYIGVVEPRDVRMLEACEDVALAKQALGELSLIGTSVG